MDLVLLYDNARFQRWLARHRRHGWELADVGCIFFRFERGVLGFEIGQFFLERLEPFGGLIFISALIFALVVGLRFL